MDREQDWKVCVVICSFFNLWCVLQAFYILVTKLENARSKKVMFLMKSAVHLLKFVLFICSVVKGSKYLALINSCAKRSFENKEDIMAHAYFQHSLVWKASRTSN